MDEKVTQAEDRDNHLWVRQSRHSHRFSRRRRSVGGEHDPRIMIGDSVGDATESEDEQIQTVRPIQAFGGRESVRLTIMSYPLVELVTGDILPITRHVGRTSDERLEAATVTGISYVVSSDESTRRLGGYEIGRAVLREPREKWRRDLPSEYNMLVSACGALGSTRVDETRQNRR
jgi:hypothetical protein